MAKRLMKLSLTIALLILAGCGGAGIAPFTPAPPPAEAQTVAPTNISVASLPLDIVYCTYNGSTPTLADKVKNVVPNYPLGGQATLILNANSVCSAPGRLITIASTQLVATAANNGTYTTVSATLNAQQDEEVVIPCAGCVTYADNGGFYPTSWTLYGQSITMDGFPAAVKDGNGTVHVLFNRGDGSQTFNPQSITETTTSDGQTFTSFFDVAIDTTLNCSNSNFFPPPATLPSACTYGGGAIGAFANGNVNVLLTHKEAGSGIVFDFTDRVYNASTHSWGTPQTNVLTGPAPDGSAWIFVLGPMYMYNNNTMACNGGFLSNNGNLYFGCNCDQTGSKWGDPSCNGGFHQISPAPPTNEGMCPPGDKPLRVFCIFRQNQIAAGVCGTPPCGSFSVYTSEDMGYTWTLRNAAIGATHAQGSWELVWPITYCPTSTTCILQYGERDTGSVGTGRMMLASINVPALFNDPGSIGQPILLDGNIPAVTDCCYGGITQLANGKLFFTWYEQFAGWKLFYGTADYLTSYGTMVTGQALVEEQVQ